MDGIIKATMNGGLLDVEAMLAHAHSDAEFDGRVWEEMDASEQERYLARVEKGYEAAAIRHFALQLNHDISAKSISDSGRKFLVF